MLIDTSAFLSTKTNCDFFLNETDLLFVLINLLNNRR